MGKKVIIVGGVAAGASAAARLRRMDEEAEIIVFERGEYVSFANCGLPYYAGGVIKNRNKLLVQTPESLYRRFNIDVRVMSEVLSIQPEQKTVEVRNIPEDKVYTESYDYLVLCPGAAPIIPDIEGVDKSNVFTLRNVPDGDIIKGYINSYRPTRATVVGAGFIGLEIAEMLKLNGLDVSIIEAAPQVMGVLDYEMAAIVQDYLKAQDINLYLSDKLLALEGESKAEQVILASGQKIATDLVILGVGVRPESRLAWEAGLAIGATGGILVDEYLRTSDPNIYAAGDAIQIKDIVTSEDFLLPMASPANRQGWLIANNIAGKAIPYTGAQGTAIVKIFDMVAATTGRNAKVLQRLGQDYQVCHTYPASHATYYPGASEMTLKIIFTPDEGKLLGAQIVGFEGVDKRIDVLATAIRAGMTVFDLQELELAYAPPFSSAKDPVNLAGYTAGNIVNKHIIPVYWQEVAQLLNLGAYLLDVRTPAEFAAGAADGAHNIPVDDLRNHLNEIPRDREILVYCRTGLRSYIACRLLTQHGYRVKNINGGYKLYVQPGNSQ